MARNPTQRYIDNEKSGSFLSNILNQTPVGVVEEIDIDLDVEKKISELQEAKLNGKSVNATKELKEWELGKQFASLLDNVGKEKEVTEEKIKKEEKKIEGLEKLLTDLTLAKGKKKKKRELLLEPEKKKPVHEEVKQVILQKPEKLDLTKTKERIAEKYVKYFEKDEPFVDEEARKIVADKYGDLSTNFPISRDVIESDPDIISKVEAQIQEMKVANELEKDKITSLRSIDTLEKLTREFLNFKQITSMQMQSIGGGGLNPEAVDSDLIPIKTNTFSLGRADRTFKDLFLSGSSLVIGGTTMDSGELTVLDSITAGTVAAGKAVVVDSNKDISGFRNVTIAGDLTVQGTTTTIDSTTIEIQNSFKFEGSTADSFETNLTTIDPTADRTISLPNATGTIVLQDTTDTLTNKTIDLDANTITGTTAEFNTALQDGSFATLAGSETLTNKSIDSDNNTITNIVNADIKAAAAIAFSKMEDLTASRALVSDSNGDVSISAVTSTEIGYLDGVTSAIQTQLDAKATNAFAIAQAVALG